MGEGVDWSEYLAVLREVRGPSRYLGSEVNAVRKDWDAVEVHVALAFPDLYEVGSSHFGIQILYHILNAQGNVSAERVFVPDDDMASMLQARGMPLLSLESRRPVGDFDILGFSLLYELNYTNVLAILDLARVPFRWQDRGGRFPLVVAGGPAVCNPEPVAEFFDAMVLGDGEEVVLELVDGFRRWRNDGARKREELWEEWSRVEGVYVPALCRGGGECGKKVWAGGRWGRVKRAVVADLDLAPFPDSPLVAYGRPVHDRMRLEVARGCTRGCRFCQAGILYRPVRERCVEGLMGLARRGLGNTGYEDLSLLSLSTGDYSEIERLMAGLMGECEGRNIAVSLPSVRAGSLSVGLMEQIRRVRKTGFTIAPEAGSQRLRDVINKSVTEKEIHDAVLGAFRLGWRNIKLYFMVGLPTEGPEDLEAMVDLVLSLRKLTRGRGRLTVSVGGFVPKAHTPFQWFRQMGLEEAGEKLEFLRRRLDIPGIKVKWHDPRMSVLEGVWARGDASLSRVLVEAYRLGCRLDGWSDRVHFEKWDEAFASQGVDPEQCRVRVWGMGDVLPWDHMDVGVTKEFLAREWDKALARERTGDCREGQCHGCGVCDFVEVRPRMAAEAVGKPEEQKRVGGDEVWEKVEVVYSKTGEAALFGHLELVAIFVRALRRAGIAMAYSKGFHPLPKISFSDPLPVGMESLEERFVVTVARGVGAEGVCGALRAQMPTGLRIEKCGLEGGRRKLKSKKVRYRVEVGSGHISKEALDRLRDGCSWVVRHRDRRGKVRDVDLGQVVEGIDVVDEGVVELVIREGEGRGLRPLEVLGYLGTGDGEQPVGGRVLKLGEDASGQ